MLATGNYPQSSLDVLTDNLNQANMLVSSFQAKVQIQQDALLVVDRQMSYMRQQLSSKMMNRYQNNYRFGGGQ